MTNKQNLKGIAKAVGYGFFVMSIIETWHCLSWFFDGGTWQDVVYAVVSSPLINFVEMICFAIWFYFKKEQLMLAGLAFGFGVIFASVSVFGSVGWVGVKYDVNLKASGEYQRLEKEQAAWQKLADDWTAEAEKRVKEKGGQGAMYAKEQAQKMQASASEVSTQLSNFTGNGSSGNALFTILANFWDTTSQNAAARGAAIYSTAKEAVMIFIFIFVMMMEQRENVLAEGENGKKKRSQENGADGPKIVHVNGKNGDSENGENVHKSAKKNGKMNVPDIDPRSKVYQETKRLLEGEWVPGKTSLQKIADQVKRSKSYVHKVKEMEKITR